MALYYAQIVSFFVLAQLLLLLYVAWSDVARRIIPNLLCTTLALSSLVIQGLSGSVLQIGLAAIIAIILFVALLVLHTYRVIGGGDVKLCIAVALGLPLWGVVSLLAVIGLAGGVLAMTHLVMRRLARPKPWVASRK
jgi:Flp pilus assembly protein protease CpaA